MPNVYDQFDAPPAANPYDQFDQPQQMSGPMRAPALVGSNIAKGALEGAGSIGDLQNFLGAGVKKYLFDPVNNAARNALGITGDFSPRMAAETSPLDSAHLTSLGRYAGAVDNPALMPQNSSEKMIAAASEGAGGALPFLPLASGNALINGARGVAQGAAAGAAGEGAAEMFPNHPLLARATGAILSGYGAGKAINAGNRVAGAMMGNSSPTVDAYRNLGIDPTLAGDVTGSPGLQMLQTYAAKSPGGANQVHAASEHAVGQFGRALEDTADSLGGARTLQQAGDALQFEGNNWLNQFKTASKQAWNAVDMQIPPQTPVAVPNYASAVNSISAQMPTAQETAKVLGRPFSAALSGALTKDQWNNLVRAGKSPNLSGPPVLSWQDVKGIRSTIGERLAEPQLVSDAGHSELKQLYGALSDDLASAAANQGPQAQTAFDQAAALTRNGHTFVENVLSNVMKGDKISPEQAAATALNGAPNGGSMLGAIRQEMPTAADQLAAYKLRDMGAATAGQQNATASRVSPGSFVTDKANLSPEAQQALFAANPDVARRVEDLATVGGSMKSTERFLNSSNTGAHSAMGHAMGSAAAAPIAAIEAYHQAGIPGAIAGVLGSLALPYIPSWAAARATTSPALTRLLAAPPAVSPQSAGLLATAGAYPQLRGLLPYASGQQ